MTQPNPDEILFTDLAQDADLMARTIFKSLAPEVQAFALRHEDRGSHLEVRVAFTREGYRFSLCICNAFGSSELWAAGAGVDKEGR